MTSIFYKTVMLLFFVSMFVSSALTPVQAETHYLGEFCFSMISNDPASPKKSLQLGASSYGAGHITLNGKKVTENAPGISPVHGTAEMDNGIIVGTLHGADTIAASITIFLRLSSETMNGNYKQLV